MIVIMATNGLTASSNVESADKFKNSEESDSAMEFVKSENNRVAMSRCIVMTALLVLGALVTTATYVFLAYTEDKSYIDTVRRSVHVHTVDLS